MANGKVRGWRKVLYEDNQGFEDNFTPSGSFLAAIERNRDVRLYSRGECLQGAAGVAREVCRVVVLWSTYRLLLTSRLPPTLLLAALALTVLAKGVQRQVALGTPAASGLRTVTLFAAIGFVLSPVLYKLTDSIATDTIHTMAATGLLLHLLTRNYGLLAPVVSSSTSLNAAVFAAVCLASRFDHHLAAFSLLSLAVLLFPPLPLAPPLLPPLPSSLLHCTAALVCLHLTCTSSTLLLAVLLLLLLHLPIPLTFHHLQSAKRTIHGPWDEAVLK